jgi:hypothetical protein
MKMVRMTIVTPTSKTNKFGFHNPRKQFRLGPRQYHQHIRIAKEEIAFHLALTPDKLDSQISKGLFTDENYS